MYYVIKKRVNIKIKIFKKFISIDIKNSVLVWQGITDKYKSVDENYLKDKKNILCRIAS